MPGGRGANAIIICLIGRQGKGRGKPSSYNVFRMRPGLRIILWRGLLTLYRNIPYERRGGDVLGGPAPVNRRRALSWTLFAVIAPCRWPCFFEGIPARRRNPLCGFARGCAFSPLLWYGRGLTGRFTPFDRGSAQTRRCSAT